jgi:hypothetical protein
MSDIKTPFHNKGWFSRSESINFFIIKRGGVIPCYICDILTPLHYIEYSRIIPKSSIPEEKKSTTNNIFIICKNCSDAKNYVQAPRNFTMALDHYIMKQQPTIQLSNELAAIEHKNKELIIKKRALEIENISLQREISELAEDNNRLVRNRALEMERANSLKIYEEASLNMVSSIISRVCIMRDQLRKLYLESTNEIIETHSNIQSNYNTVMSLISKEQSKLSDLASIEVNCEYSCNICCNRQIQKTFIPCGHVLCEVCLNKLEEDNNVRCPFCKSEYTDTLRIFV